MSRQYSNILKHLQDNFEILTSVEDYCKMDEKLREFSFKCKSKNHINTLKHSSYVNKRSLFNKENKPIIEFCVFCSDENNKENNFEIYKEQILEKTGHLLLSYDVKSRSAEYICGNCNELSKTHMSTLMHNNLGSCCKCQNIKFRLTYDKLKNDVESHGFKLLTKQDEYISNKQKLNVICKCGYEYQTYLVSIRQDKHCKNCKIEKYEKSCMEKYNERNIMHVDEIFYKCQENFSTAKEYSFKESERKIIIQGTEDIIINYLLNNENKILKRKIKEDEILQKNIPSFKYTYDNKIHKYYPDFYIRDTKLIIEAKTINTHNKLPYRLTNYLKYKSAVNNGYNIIVIILNNKNKLFDIWYFLENGKEISVLKENGINIIFNNKLFDKMKLDNIEKLCNDFDLNKYL